MPRWCTELSRCQGGTQRCQGAKVVQRIGWYLPIYMMPRLCVEFLCKIRYTCTQHRVQLKEVYWQRPGNELLTRQHQATESMSALAISKDQNIDSACFQLHTSTYSVPSYMYEFWKQMPLKKYKRTDWPWGIKYNEIEISLCLFKKYKNCSFEVNILYSFIKSQNYRSYVMTALLRSGLLWWGINWSRSGPHVAPTSPQSGFKKQTKKEKYDKM